MSSKTYEVPNISCGHCTATIEKELKLLDGVEAVQAQLDTKKVTVETRDDAILNNVEQTLEEIGYPAR